MWCSHLALTLSPAFRDLLQGKTSRWLQYLKVSDVNIVVNTSVTRPGVNPPTLCNRGVVLQAKEIYNKLFEGSVNKNVNVWNLRILISPTRFTVYQVPGGW